MPFSISIDLATAAYSSVQSGFRRLLGKKSREFVDPSGFSISGVVPTYQGEDSLEKTVRSLFAQSLPLKNVIVVDDASTDRTVDVAARLSEEFGNRLVYIRREKNSGKAANLNYASLDERVGDFMYVLDSDCEADTGAVEKLARNFTSEKIGAVTSFGYTLPPKDFIARQFHYGMSWNNSLFRFRKSAQSARGAVFVVCGASTMFSTDAVREIPFRDLTKTEDTDETWRLQEAGFKVLYEPEAEAFSKDLERFSSMRRQWSRWYSGTFQNLFVHGKDTMKAKSLFWTTIVPGTLDSIIGTVSIAAMPIIAGAELSGAADVPYVTPSILGYAAALDLALTAVPTLALEPKRIMHLPQIYAYRLAGSFLTLKAAGTTIIQKLLGQEAKWSNRWGRNYNLALDPVQVISRDYMQNNMQAFEALEHNWTALGERAWDENNFMYELDGKWDLSLRVHDGKNLVGYLIGAKVDDKRAAIKKILVDSSVSGEGFGHKLITRFEQLCKEQGYSEIEFKALVENDRANEFYQGHGYSPVEQVLGDDGLMRHFYVKDLASETQPIERPIKAESPWAGRARRILSGIESIVLVKPKEEEQVELSRPGYSAQYSYGIKSADIPCVAKAFNKASSIEDLIDSLNEKYNIGNDVPRQVSFSSVASAIDRSRKNPELHGIIKPGRGIKDFAKYVTNTYNLAAYENGKRATNAQISQYITEQLISDGYTGRELTSSVMNKYLHIAEDLFNIEVDWKRKRKIDLSENDTIPVAQSSRGVLGTFSSAARYFSNMIAGGEI